MQAENCTKKARRISLKKKTKQYKARCIQRFDTRKNWDHLNLFKPIYKILNTLILSESTRSKWTFLLIENCITLESKSGIILILFQGAINSMTKALAVDEARYNVRVNSWVYPSVQISVGNIFKSNLCISVFKMPDSSWYRFQHIFPSRSILNSKWFTLGYDIPQFLCNKFFSPKDNK